MACRPWAEVWALAGARLGLLDQGAPANDRYFAATDRLARRFVDDSVRLVVAREDACVHAFRAARPHAALRLYDLPTAHYETVRAIMGVARRPSSPAPPRKAAVAENTGPNAIAARTRSWRRRIMSLWRRSSCGKACSPDSA